MYNVVYLHLPCTISTVIAVGLDELVERYLQVLVEVVARTIRSPLIMLRSKEGMGDLALVQVSS